MGVPILYGADFSPPVRSVLLTAEAIDLKIDYRQMNLHQKEHLSDEYLKKNPQHTIPVLEDDGKCIWDSQAIVAYLITKYAKDDSLYPKEPYQRAIVDQRLHFNSSVLFPSLRDIVYLITRQYKTDIPQQLIDNIYLGYDFVEKFLDINLYFSGNTLTISDFCAASTIASLKGFAPIQADRFPKIDQWMKRLNQLPYYKKMNTDKAERGMQELMGLIAALKEKNGNDQN